MRKRFTRPWRISERPSTALPKPISRSRGRSFAWGRILLAWTFSQPYRALNLMRHGCAALTK